jgi:CubicO group peptidase (beta-lactamase class C family)
MFPTRRIFLKQLGFATGGWILASRAPSRLWAAETSGLPRSTPEAQGMDSAGILAFLEALAEMKIELHSLMVVRHGAVVAEGWWAPYGAALNHGLYSLSKSFTSTAIGLAVSEGRLTVEDRVTSFFPNDLPDTVSENLAALRVKDLLTMSVGQTTEPTGEMVKQENWVKTFLAWPIAHPPGSVFLYNSSATYMLSAIVQHLTGQTVLEYLRPRLFEPLGIAGMTWETCPRGINTGGWGLSIQTEGLVKFGELLRQKGVWSGKEILPAKWIEEATTFKIQQPAPAKPSRPSETNDWLQGYCYQFWRCTHGAFRGDGAFGQFMIVLPEQDAVVAITGESGNLQGELDLVWAHLLPALKPGALPAQPEVQERLRTKLGGLILAPPEGAADSPMASAFSGKTFRFEANDLGLQSVAFSFQKDGCLLTFRDGQVEYPIASGISKWQSGETALPRTPPRLVSGGAAKPGTKAKIAAAGAWKDEKTFAMTWRYIETPHHDAVTCEFDGDKVTITFVNSMAQMNGATKDKRPVLTGRATA